MHDLFIRVHDQLPIFKIAQGKYMVLYTPGYSIKTEEISYDELRSLFRDQFGAEKNNIRNLVCTLLEKAHDATKKWELQKQSPFTPECLTIHVGSDCNFNCTYCYADIEKTGNRKIVGFPSVNAIEAITEYISEKVKVTSQRLTVVYHGSGEPTIHWAQLINSFRSISRIAKQKEIRLFNYIATNGCLDEKKIDWLANHMDLIGLSCDGTPDIQGLQRKAGSIQNLPIEKVCEKILEKRGTFDMRVTVTPSTVARLPETTEYLIEKCKAINIRIEPVYLSGEKGFKEEDADEFFNMFIKSRMIAREHSVSFGYAGIRMPELHGAYCDALRNTIRLTSDDITRNCFCFMSDKEGYITGGYKKEQPRFYLRTDINELKNKAYQIPNDCYDCINVYHCSRGCPDYCNFESDYHEQRNLNPFRCRLHQLIAVDSAIGSAVMQYTNY